MANNDMRRRLAMMLGDCPITIKGIPPITTARRRLLSLKAFGGTEQRNLPDGYIERQYIYMLDGAYIRVEDLPISAGYKVEFDFQVKTLGSALRNYLGGRADGVSAGGGFRLSKLASSGTNLNRVVMYGFETGTEYYDPTTQFQADTRYKYTYNNGVCTLESGGSVISTNTFTPTDTTSTDWGINDYCSNGGWSAYHDGMYVYSVKVWNDQGELVMDLVPAVQRGAVPVVGFYDAATGEFRGPTGGTFAAGPEAVPTPDAPMDIICNNGIIRLKDAELPLGYRRITGLTMNNNCYYVIPDFHLFGKTDVIRFSYSITNSGVNVIGSYTTGTAQTNYSLYTTTADSASYMRYNGGTYNSTSALNTRYNVVWGPTGTTGMENPSTWDTVDFETATDFYIGTTSTAATSPKMRGTFYGNIEVDGRLKLIPCERTIDGEVGYYDTYAKRFYAPTGTTPTILAYDSEHLVLYAESLGPNIFDSSSIWNLNGSMYQGADYLEFPYSTGGNKFTFFFEVEPDTVYVISADTLGDRLYIGALDHIVDPTTYTTSNKLRFDRIVTVRNNPTVGATITTRATDKMIGVYYSNTTLPVNFKIQKMTTKETIAIKDDQNVTVSTATAEILLKVGDYQDVQSILDGVVTRNVGVMVFDGSENWVSAGSGSSYRCHITYDIGLPNTDTLTSPMICSHYQFGGYISGGGATTQGTFNAFARRTPGNEAYYLRFSIVGMGITTANGFKAWLAAQYAAGTPVIVVYPLETPTTESVAGQTMALTSGTNVIDITQASLNNLELEVKTR